VVFGRGALQIFSSERKGEVGPAVVWCSTERRTHSLEGLKDDFGLALGVCCSADQPLLHCARCRYCDPAESTALSLRPPRFRLLPSAPVFHAFDDKVCKIRWTLARKEESLLCMLDLHYLLCTNYARTYLLLLSKVTTAREECAARSLVVVGPRY